MTPATTSPPRANGPIAAAPPVTRTAESYFGYTAITLRYLESSPILVTGTATGRRYEFSGAHPDQLVDARDAKALLLTRFFRRGY